MSFSEFKRRRKRTLNRVSSSVLLNPVLCLPNCASPQEQERGSATLFLSRGTLLPPPPHLSELSHSLFLGVASSETQRRATAPDPTRGKTQEECSRELLREGRPTEDKARPAGLPPATRLRTRRNISHHLCKSALQSARSKGTLLPCWLSPTALAWKEDGCNVIAGGNYSLQTTLTSTARRVFKSPCGTLSNSSLAPSSALQD